VPAPRVVLDNDSRDATLVSRHGIVVSTWTRERNSGHERPKGSSCSIRLHAYALRRRARRGVTFAAAVLGSDDFLGVPVPRGDSDGRAREEPLAPRRRVRALLIYDGERSYRLHRGVPPIFAELIGRCCAPDVVPSRAGAWNEIWSRRFPFAEAARAASLQPSSSGTPPPMRARSSWRTFSGLNFAALSRIVASTCSAAGGSPWIHFSGLIRATTNDRR